ncbi:PTS transporter subunit EIIC [Latilactobacillus sakei]
MPTLEQFGRDGFAATANLNYAFLHHTPWHVPYPFTLGTLYGPFGAIGGTGGTLALVIAIFLFSRQRDQHLIGRRSLMPVLFNFNSAVLTGLPVLGNGLYIIPFLLVPLVNMGIAALAIALNLMPAVVYNVPLGTPGLLQAFIGTNGNWMALVISLLNVFVGVLIYKPFIQLANRLQEGVDQDV